MRTCAGNAETYKECTAPAKSYNGVRKYCGRHHAIGLRADEEYRIQHALGTEASIEEWRAAREQERNRLLAIHPNTLTPEQRKRYAGNVIRAWQFYHIPTLDIPAAYTIVCYGEPDSPGYRSVWRALVEIYIQVQNPPAPNPADQYLNIPAAERQHALTVLHETVAHLDADDIVRQLRDHGDTMCAAYVRTRLAEMEMERIRQRVEAAAAERVLRMAAAAAAAAAADAAAERVLRMAQAAAAAAQAPQVFARDPEGSVDLRAFANDTQSVHRSSVQTATERAIAIVLRHPVPTDQNTILEISTQFTRNIRFYPANATDTRTREAITQQVIDELTSDYNLKSAFDHTYAEVLDHVWSFIRSQVHKKELVIRLAQEVIEGTGMCSNGKMARLLNVLQGFDDALVAVPPRELFQSAIARLMANPLDTREAAARSLFTEYQIPAEEHAVWLEPLLEV